MPNSRFRLWTDALVLAVTVAALLSQRLPDGNGVRVVASLLAAALLPGAAALTRFRVTDFPAWIGLAAALSFGIEAVVSSVALWLHVWEPAGVIAVLAVPSFLVVAADAWARLRSAGEPEIGQPEGAGAARDPGRNGRDRSFDQETQRLAPWTGATGYRAPADAPVRPRPARRDGPGGREPGFDSEQTQRIRRSGRLPRSGGEQR